MDRIKVSNFGILSVVFTGGELLECGEVILLISFSLSSTSSSVRGVSLVLGRSARIADISSTEKRVWEFTSSSAATVSAQSNSMD